MPKKTTRSQRMEKLDQARDKKMGVKELSARDKKMDASMMKKMKGK